VARDPRLARRSRGRILLVVVAIALVAFSVQPLRSYRDAQRRLHVAQAELTRTKAAEKAAVDRRAFLGTNAALIREARRQGYILPGETPYALPQTSR
jgi:cell division protein FtsB